MSVVRTLAKLFQHLPVLDDGPQRHEECGRAGELCIPSVLLCRLPGQVGQRESVRGEEEDRRPQRGQSRAADREAEASRPARHTRTGRHPARDRDRTERRTMKWTTSSDSELPARPS